MQILIHTVLILTQSVTFGSSITNDVVLAARMLPDGNCGLLVQSSVAECPATYGIVLVALDGAPVIIPLETGIDSPVWVRGSGWTSDGVLSLILSSYATGHEFTDIALFSTDGEFSRSIRIPAEERSLEVAEGERYVINAFLPCDDGSGFWMSTDLVDSESFQVFSKTLLRLGSQGDTLWSRDISCPDYWMNPDVIVSMPDGGCVVGSDEDGYGESGFDQLLYLNRLSSTGDLLWSVEIETEGEMIHTVEDILSADDGGTLVIASSDRFGMQDNCLICLINREGQIVSKVFEAGLGHAVCTCGLPIEGGFLLAGWTGPAIEDHAQPLDEDILLLRLDESGTPIEMDIIPVDDNREPRFILETPSGYLIVGSCWQDYFLECDAFAMPVPSEGTFEEINMEEERYEFQVY